MFCSQDWGCRLRITYSTPARQVSTHRIELNGNGNSAIVTPCLASPGSLVQGLGCLFSLKRKLLLCARCSAQDFMQGQNQHHRHNPNATRCNTRLLIGCKLRETPKAPNSVGYLRDAPKLCTDVRRTPVLAHLTGIHATSMPGAQIITSGSTGQSFATFAGG